MKKTTLTQIGITILTLGIVVFTLTGSADASLTRTAPMEELEQHQIIPRDKVTEINTIDAALTPPTDYLYGEIGDLVPPDGTIVKTASLVPWELLSCDYMGLFMRYFGQFEG